MVFLARETSLGYYFVKEIPPIIRLITYLFSLVLIDGSDDGTLSIDDDDTVGVLVGLHSVEGLF